LSTGRFAYKIKRPVHHAFIDLRSPERREFFCREELRLNQRFAPELYIDVCEITSSDGRARIGDTKRTALWSGPRSLRSGDERGCGVDGSDEACREQERRGLRAPPASPEPEERRGDSESSEQNERQQRVRPQASAVVRKCEARRSSSCPRSAAAARARAWPQSCAHRW
jgi:hypothetical protein